MSAHPLSPLPRPGTTSMTPDWMRLENEDRVASPALLVYRDRIEANLDRMVAIVGDPARLRPHVKTHKTPQIVALQVQRGITRCKCATIAEAEMSAGAGATDVLLAAQPVGPNVARLLALIEAYPAVRFSTIVDEAQVARVLGAAAAARGARVDVLVDLDVGQHRTGIAPGEGALELCRLIAAQPGLRFRGLHVYDGHITIPDLSERASAVVRVYDEVDALRARLERDGLSIPVVVAGGTPTFPLHARRPEVECGPGTCVLWDAGYATNLRDLEFLTAAILLTRVISRPAADRLCLDLGHKAVASEMPHPRVVFPALPGAVPVLHSEEHLVLETPRAAEFPVGSVLYGIPWHICPTVALHASLQVVENRRATEEWPVVARQRRLRF
jgi:D-serine deaminase-like pyridoxal phosphate-dependent protein